MVVDRCQHPLCGSHDAFLASRRTRGLSEHTLRRYRNDIHGVALHMAPDAGIPDLEHQLADALNDYAVGRTRSTVAGAVSTWTTWVNALINDEVIVKNPLRRVERPKVTAPTPKSLVNPVEAVERIYATLQGGPGRPGRRPWPERDLALIATYLGTGVRLHELTAANMRDISTGGNARLKVVGKGDKERWAPVPPEVVDVLTAYQATRHSKHPDIKVGPTSPLICNDDGERLKDYQVQYIVTKVYEAAGVSAQKPSGALVHALRHTCATLMVAAKQPATSVQGVLGHASLATSQRYVKVTDEAIHEAARSSPAMAALRRPEPDAG